MLRDVPGAVDVVADQSIGKGYLEITIDRQKAARYGVNVGDIQDVIEVALGGKDITMTVEGRERFPVRIRYARAWREDEEQSEEPAGQRGRRGHGRGRGDGRCGGSRLGHGRQTGRQARRRASPCKSRWRWSPTCGSSKARA